MMGGGNGGGGYETAKGRPPRLGEVIASISQDERQRTTHIART